MTRAYRLAVVYPDGSQYDPAKPEDRRWLTWEPPGYDGSQDFDSWRAFHWPRARTYLSRGAANRRADLLRKYGATVTVVASDPITFPEAP